MKNFLACKMCAHLFLSVLYYSSVYEPCLSSSVFLFQPSKKDLVDGVDDAGHDRAHTRDAGVRSASGRSDNGSTGIKLGI